VDLHTPQIEGFFHAPVDSLTAVPTLCEALRDRVPANIAVISPDVGRVRMATRYAEHYLGASVVVLHKQRMSGSETKVTHVVGEVSGRTCLIIDDMISTGGTVAESITALLAAGARPEMFVAATHGLFVLDARRKLSHPAVREVYVTDTISVVEKDWPQLHVISIAPLLASAVQRFLTDGSPAERHETADRAPRRETRT
jgi:ribose-phosphate pyrophosphokinase